jgi:signal-transduction protein with cAMP-binding, CBS, and nucleotidyltransferase domain
VPTAPRQVWGDLATTAFVEASHLFKSLDADARRDLLQLATVTSWAPGELVSGEDDDGFYLVLDGTAAEHTGGREVAALERGAVFGTHRVAGGPARAWSLAARTDVTAVVFPAVVMGALAARFPKVERLLEAVAGAREKLAQARLGA